MSQPMFSTKKSVRRVSPTHHGHGPSGLPGDPRPKLPCGFGTQRKCLKQARAIGVALHIDRVEIALLEPVGAASCGDDLHERHRTPVSLLQISKGQTRLTRRHEARVYFLQRRECSLQVVSLESKVLSPNHASSDRADKPTEGILEHEAIVLQRENFIDFILPSICFSLLRLKPIGRIYRTGAKDGLGKRRENPPIPDALWIGDVVQRNQPSGAHHAQRKIPILHRPNTAQLAVAV